MSRMDSSKTHQSRGPTAKRSETKPPRSKPWEGQGESRPHRPKSAPASQEKNPSPFRQSSPDVILLHGFHAVREALRSDQRTCLALYATEAAAEKLAPDSKAAGLAPHIVTAEDLSRRLGSQTVHQGVLLEARPLEPLDITEIPTRSGVVLVLDQITDPHNVGAIVRTAAAFDVDAIVTTERHAPALGGVLAKAASGGLEHVQIVPVVNLARALETLGRLNYLRVGLDSAAEADFTQLPLQRPIALVLGGEGTGLRRLTREKCDFLARLDMPGKIKSLNVSNACAVVLTLIGRI
ncbi:23S rRNA (guanosine(2251)-2'-O)-methyltransferase RlmB [Beijerinckia indica]|uniref:RNA methyltransferase, TrmH family, group 3 n=1 Tax=Beijerinckia indica subsp. indica (strain ATCC 9039 / DSM 1715 / NCIMB 8712) TaxID=395963 RepID=B2IK44_BEII9|nr:23S rRNA (guanosine(2251)-2'-O)-methyltransferase RlmB [Beijerinckia indica]ACB94976.1 RNA methyltransferase, TrmH family, group 3 [Beijerinckia indica subsp. indica ATCC 9039]